MGCHREYFQSSVTGALRGIMKLDLGCGLKKQEGHLGVDSIALAGVDVVYDLRLAPWPWPDNSADRIFSAHFVEHLTSTERIIFFNEVYRVLKPGSEAEIITPDWSHASAYGDPTHQWPPMSHWYLVYLNKVWRDKNTPHVPYTCDFTSRYSFSLDDSLQDQTMEAKRYAVEHNINSARDLQAVLTKRV